MEVIEQEELTPMIMVISFHAQFDSNYTLNCFLFTTWLTYEESTCWYIICILRRVKDQRATESHILNPCWYWPGWMHWFPFDMTVWLSDWDLRFYYKGEHSRSNQARALASFFNSGETFSKTSAWYESNQDFSAALSSGISISFLCIGLCIRFS